MAQHLGELYSSLDDATMRGLFLEVVRVLPESRSTVIDFLREQNSDRTLQRTVSIDNLVDPSSGFHVSTPTKKKAKGRKSKIKCNGHQFTCHNYIKPTKCAVCGEFLEGLTHQGYQCRSCLLDVHYRCGGLLEKCRASELVKAKKLQIKQEKKVARKSSSHLPTKTRHDDDHNKQVVQLRSRFNTSSADDESVAGDTIAQSPGQQSQPDDPTYIVALPMSPKASSGNEENTGADDVENMDPSRLIASPTKRLSSTTHLTIAENEECEVDSSDNSDYYEENSSDANSESDDDDVTSRPSRQFGSKAFVRGGTSTSKRRSSSGSMKSLARSFRNTNSVIRGRGKTGAAADWKRHGASFRARLNARHPHTQETLAEFVNNPSAAASEFGNIPENRVNLLTTPKLTEGKNRYMNILPNNHSRVVLDQIGDDETSKYINANWMKGYGGKDDEFIACQGPLPSTVGDFWRMIWQCKVKTIAMNTGLVELGKEKCERYWPLSADGSDEAVMIIGDFKIEALDVEQIVPEFQLTRLKCTYQGECRDLNHYWWTKWPDKGVPETSNGIAAFIEAIRLSQKDADGPAVIHCSAGIGRTGCFLTINYCMHQYDKEGQVDILESVGKLRQDRGMTVQTESQYMFIHTVMLKYMKGTLREAEKKPPPQPKPKPASIDSSRLNVIRSPDRVPGSTMARKASTKHMAMKLSKRRSSADISPTKNRSPTRREYDLSTEHEPVRNIVAEQSFPHGNHVFRAKTFVRPTQCAVCEEMLAGLALQGARCSRCKQDVHFRCLSKCDKQCNLVSNVKRQKSGLPSWPPQRPSKFSSKLTSTGNILMEE